MADASYDVVLIGGGNKALIAAMYLTKYGGMSVGIFEDKHELGTGWCSEESPAPGFLADHCSKSHNREDFLLVWEDFPEWEEYGAKPLDYTVCSSIIFQEDDTCCGMYSAQIDPTQEKTAKWFARLSQKDADTWLRLWGKVQKYIREAVREWFWNPPPPPGEPDSLDRLLMNPDSGVDPQWLVMTYPQLFNELFESPEVRMTWARKLHAGGIQPHAYGGAFAVVTSFVDKSTMISFPGGTHALTHASHRVILENGGKAFTQSPVQKIIIENGTAKGVRLADGTEVKARYAVLSGVDPYQLCVELIGEEHLNPKIIRKIENLERDWMVVAWYGWALREAPRYRAESFEPDIQHAGSIALGVKTFDHILDENKRRIMGMWPDPNKMCLLIVGATSLPGDGYAPSGMSSVTTEHWAVPAYQHTEQEWKVLEKQIAEEKLRWWQRYAPNMTWDNVIGYVPVTPFFLSKHSKCWGPSGNLAIIDNTPPQVGRWRPIPELASGRMPIKNLYATGAAWGPKAGAQAWQGYNVYKVMAEDFGLRKPWEEKGRRY